MDFFLVKLLAKVIEIIAGRLKKCWNKVIMQRFNRGIVNKFDDVIVFEHAVPYCNLDNITFKDGGYCFYREVPAIYREEFKKYCKSDGTPHFVSRDGRDFCDDVHKTPLYEFIFNRYPEIKDIDIYLNKIAEDTAEVFLDRLKAGKLAFNNQMWGIDKISESKTYNSNSEASTLDITLFTTDYFTYKFMVNVYKDLNMRNPKVFSAIQKISDLNKYRPFFCSIGVGGFILANRKGSPELLWVKRSAGVAQPTKWHFSYDETFNLQDKSNIKVVGTETIPCLVTCIRRGLIEELGLGYHKSGYNVNDDDIKVISFALIKNDERLEFEFFSYTKVSFGSDTITTEDFDLMRRTLAKDASYEAIDVVFMPLTKRDINKLISDKDFVQTPESIFLAKSFLMRKKTNYL